jgi:hypothetical protein
MRLDRRYKQRSGCILSIAFLLLLSSCGYLQPSKPDVIPILSCSGLPCVDVGCGSDASARLLVDFASGRSYLSNAKVSQSVTNGNCPGIRTAQGRGTPAGSRWICPTYEQALPQRLAVGDRRYSFLLQLEVLPFEQVFQDVWSDEAEV